MSELEERRATWPAEKEKWVFILETFWGLDSGDLLRLIKRFATLDALYDYALRTRDSPFT